MNSVAYLPQSKRLLEQVSEVLRYKHYSLKTEQAYLYWVRFSVRWHGRDGQMQHPRSMGGAEVTQFLTVLANERRVSVSTHNQALSALLFLYREVLAINLPWLTEVQRPTRPRRIPSVLTKAEVASLLGAMDGEMALLAKLLNGTGMRLMEGLRLHRVHARGAAGRNRGGGSPTDKLRQQHQRRVKPGSKQRTAGGTFNDKKYHQQPAGQHRAALPAKIMQGRSDQGS